MVNFFSSLRFLRGIFFHSFFVVFPVKKDAAQKAQAAKKVHHKKVAKPAAQKAQAAKKVHHKKATKPAAQKAQAAKNYFFMCSPLRGR